MRIIVRSSITFALVLALGAVYLAFQSALAQQSCATPPQGVGAWYPFDGNALDIQGGNHAALSGNPAFAPGKVGQAMQFDGADDSAKVSATSSTNVGAGGGMTIALWINPADTNDHALVEWNTAVISGCDFCSLGTHLWLNRPNGSPGGLGASLVNVQGGSQGIQADPGTITANSYQHIALTYDKASGIARLYRDGVIVAEKNMGSFTPQTSYDLYLGLRPASLGGPGRYQGAMDDLQIFNRALTQADIQTIYNAGNSGPALCRLPDSFQFLTETLAINEVNGSVSLAVTRRGNVSGAATVQYATTTGGTATPNVDFTETSGTLSFAEGEASKTFSIPLNVDSITEPDETIEVALSNPTGGASLGTPSTEVVTIADPRSTTQPGRLLTSTGASQGGIVEFNTDGSNGLNLTPNPFDGGCHTGIGYKDYHPSVSRDGKLIAFASSREPSSAGRPRIFVMNADGSNLRQLTFNVPSGEFQAIEVRDLNPVISPDGTRVAFISNRAVHTLPPGAPSGYQYRSSDIYIVNTDGTGLHPVTTLQTINDPNNGTVPASNIVSVVWNPDGTRLAFRGTRLVMEGNPSVARSRQIVSTINADGSGETPVAIIQTTGQFGSLDWSPTGQIAYVWGGEAQGAPQQRLVIDGTQYLYSDFPAIADAPGDAGSMRFSPDGQRIGWVNNQGRFVSVNTAASGRIETPPVGVGAGEPIWWQPGAPITPPARLELAPDPVTVWEGGGVQMTPTLSDHQNNVLARAATAWRLELCSGGSASVTNTGFVTARTNLNYTDRVCASNGGRNDCATVQNLDIPILSVSATTPETARSGTGAPGAFSITRVGNPTGALVINFAMSGSAVRDVDYTLDATGGTVSGNTVTMPPNQTGVTINVRPLSTAPGGGDKTVFLTLQPDSSNGYLVNDQAKTAQVLIRDGVNPPTPPTLSLAAITPDKGGDEGFVTATVYGQNIQPGATVKLARNGQDDIPGSAGVVTANGLSITTTFDLAGGERGAWNVVVTNPNNQTATLPGAFTIQETKGPQVWVDVIGRYTFRSGLTERFYIAYGNRGDVDTEPTMIRVFIPAGLKLEGLPTLADGTFPAILQQDDGTALEFYVKGIAAGLSSYLPINMTADPALAHEDVKVRAFAMSSPSFESAMDVQLDPSAAFRSEIIENTANHSKAIIHFTNADDSFDITYEVRIEDDTQARPRTFEVVENEDTLQYSTSISYAEPPSITGQNAHGKRQEVKYKKASKFMIMPTRSSRDEATSRLAQSVVAFRNHTVYRTNRKQLVDCLIRLGIFDPIYDPAKLAKKYESLGTAVFVTHVIQTLRIYEGSLMQAEEHIPRLTITTQDTALEPFINEIIHDIFTTRRNPPVPPDLQAIYDRGNSNDPVIGNGAVWQQVLLLRLIQKCGCEKETGSLSHAQAKGLKTASTEADGPSCNTCSGGKCMLVEKEVTFTIIFSFDPNDKVGTQGAGPQGYVTGNDPINYAVFFENKEEATAPAQKVVITDQLDTSKLDLSTFSLGMFSFGDTVVAAPPGLSDYTTDVDLRPANELIVRINAELDETTGLVTVQFTSLDPATMQPTTDPFAGFLPPNEISPEGQGSFTYSITPKSNLATGDEIRNRARIIFDANAPIDTPEWLNTIDKSKPSSQVAPLAATQCGSFEVSWSGADAGAGVQSYSVYMSENGGPYTLWQLDTTDTHATFTGQPGKSYSFYSVAQDGADNTEDAPASADATTTISSVEPPAVTAPPDKTFETQAGTTTCGVIIDDAALGTATVTGGCSTPTLSRSGVPVGNLFPVGTTVITYTATDGSGNVLSTAEQKITVVDRTPPVISAISVTKTELWPANHKMVDISLSYNVGDNCDSNTGITRTIYVTSNEPVNGTGDGDTSPDWEVIDANRVRLRAERSGNGQGRIYTIKITATDSKGNASSRSVTVKVPKSK